jgi:hypothetical protein
MSFQVAREAYETVKGGNAENVLKEWKVSVVL